MKRPSQWPRWHWLALAFLSGVGATVAGVFLITRPADSGTADPPPDVTCRGLLREPGFYAGRLVRLGTAGMTPGPHPDELVYVRVFGLPPAVVCRFDAPAPVPIPGHVVGRVEVPEKGPVVLTGCRAD